MIAPARSRGLACLRCGGALQTTARGDVLRCRFCDTTHLWTEGEQVEALTFAGRLGRRRAQRHLADALRAEGVLGHVVESMRLVWLPFWQVDARLVGWLRYRPAPAARTLETDPDREARRRATEAAAVPLEEMIAREIQWSQPACDLRGWGLLGIADRLPTARLVPFVQPEPRREEWAGAVTVARSTALRRALGVHGQRVAPPRATEVRTRLDLLQPRTRLLYYPVWNLQYRVNGEPHEAVLDGLRGTPLRGTASAPRRGEAAWWLGVASAGGWLSGWNPVFAALGVAGWCLHRASRAGVRGDGRAWLAWWGSELQWRAPALVRLGDRGKDRP